MKKLLFIALLSSFFVQENYSSRITPESDYSYFTCHFTEEGACSWDWAKRSYSECNNVTYDNLDFDNPRDSCAQQIKNHLTYCLGNGLMTDKSYNVVNPCSSDKNPENNIIKD